MRPNHLVSVCSRSGDGLLTSRRSSAIALPEKGEGVKGKNKVPIEKTKKEIRSRVVVIAGDEEDAELKPKAVEPEPEEEEEGVIEVEPMGVEVEPEEEPEPKDQPVDLSTMGIIGLR